MNKKKITSPFITKYEKARIIGTRAEQISNNAEPLIDIKDLINPILIAEKEYYAKKIPLIICRILPNNDKEYWSLDELIL